MTADIINLRKARKQKARAEKVRQAAENRAKHGQTKAARRHEEANKVLEEKIRVERRLGNLKPSLAKDVLNAPMLDFMAPTLKVQQIVLDDLYDDYHFTKTQKSASAGHATCAVPGVAKEFLTTDAADYSQLGKIP